MSCRAHLTGALVGCPACEETHRQLTGRDLSTGRRLMPGTHAAKLEAVVIESDELHAVIELPNGDRITWTKRKED